MKKIIGNTPLIRIHYKIDGEERSVCAKLEYYNLTGSIKDRMVYYLLTKNKENGNIKEGMPIVEATSGNTGISLASLGAYFGHPVHIFIPDFVSEERIKILKLYGANVHLVSKEEGGYLAAISKADAFSKKIGGYRLDQFEKIENISAHFATTGTEIVKKLPQIDGFVSGVGTGGTLMGCALKIKEQNEKAIIGAVEPYFTSILTGNVTSTYHQIEGIADGFLPKIVDKNVIDKVYRIYEEDAILMSQKLALSLGLGVGISSGANLLGSILMQDTVKGEVCTIFPDDFKKYLSTNLTIKIEEKEEYITPNIELISYEVL